MSLNIVNKEVLSSDGIHTLKGKVYIPDTEIKGLFHLVHGMTEYIGRYDEFLRFMAESGYVAFAYDHLGHGETGNATGELGFIAEKNGDKFLPEDVHVFGAEIRRDFPGKKCVIMGHSMGSYMLRKYLCLHGENLSGAVIMGTGCVPDGTMKFGMTLCKFLAFFRGWNYRSKLVQKLSYSKPYHKFDLYGKDYTNSWLTKDVEHVKKYYSDPRCTFLFTLNGYYGLMEAVYFDNQMDNIKKVPKDLPVFMVSGADDPVGDLGEGVKKVNHMYKDAGVDDLTYRLYETDRHEILNETDRDKVYADLLAWMRVRIDT